MTNENPSDDDKARVRRVLITIAHDRVAAGKSTAADMAEGMIGAGVALLSAQKGISAGVAKLREMADALESTGVPREVLH